MGLSSPSITVRDQNIRDTFEKKIVFETHSHIHAFILNINIISSAMLVQIDVTYLL